MASWFSRWQHWRRAGPAERPQLYRPALEPLEDRCLLSTGYVQTNLASDVPGQAPVTDPNLINPWGISLSPAGAFWFSDNGSGVSDLLDGNGQPLPLVVTIPSAPNSSASPSGGSPSGTVFNGGPGFNVSQNGQAGSSIFLFDSEDGTISGWNPDVNQTQAIVAVNNPGASYTGLTLATNSAGQSLLYAANFGQGRIDVFDQNFQSVPMAGAFQDLALPANYAPFNVQNINGLLYVTYAAKQPAGTDAQPGAGQGAVAVYTPQGTLVTTLTSGGALNAPWGLAQAPSNFGAYSGALLVGNNGDGHINAYDPTTGSYLGQLADGTGTPITITGLWGLQFGNDHLGGSPNALFFTAGGASEQHGLFGAIQTPQGAAGGTAGSLPYVADDRDDGYPLPPAVGPALPVLTQPAPTPALLPLTGSSLALAPTLSITADPGPASAVLSTGVIGTTVPLSPTGSPQGVGTPFLFPAGQVPAALVTGSVGTTTTPIMATAGSSSVVPSTAAVSGLSGTGQGNSALPLGAFLDLHATASSGAATEAPIQVSQGGPLEALPDTGVVMSGPLLRELAAGPAEDEAGLLSIQNDEVSAGLAAGELPGGPETAPQADPLAAPDSSASFDRPHLVRAFALAVVGSLTWGSLRLSWPRLRTGGKKRSS
jgi:uncharacterized protein (TIGR03118 family)